MGTCLSLFRGAPEEDPERQPLLVPGVDSRSDGIDETVSGCISTALSFPGALPHFNNTDSNTVALERSTLPFQYPNNFERQLQSPERSKIETAGVTVALQNNALVLDSLHKEAQRHRGDLVAARAEVSTVFTEVHESSYQDERRQYIHQLPLVPNASYDESLGCLRTTRIKILAEIANFLTNTTASPNVFMLSGPAGSGKTAISHSVAHICDDIHHSLASSFFFKADVNLRDKPDQLISSIARDLAGKNSEYASLLSETVKGSPNLATAPINRQFQKLLVELTSQLPPNSPPVAIVVDAIDEGWAKPLLDILESWAQLPSWIRLFATFRDDGSVPSRLRTSSHMCWFDLDITAESNTDDIQLYVAEKLRAVAADRELTEWPTPNDINKLCRKANGLFVWAAVACNSIDDVDLAPIEQFNELVEDDELRDTRAADQMDELYLKVLSKCPLENPRALSRYQQCLGAVLSVRKPLSAAALNELLGVSYVSQTLRRLAPVLSGLVPVNVDNPIQTIHQTFRQFVTQGTGKHVISRSDQDQSLALRCLILIHERMPTLANHTQWLNDEKQDEKTGVPLLPENTISVALRYSCKFLLAHLTGVECVSPDLSLAVEKFMYRDIYGWLGLSAMMGECQDVRTLIEWVKHVKGIPQAQTIIIDPINSFPKLMYTLSQRLSHNRRLEEALLCADIAIAFCQPVGDGVGSEALSANMLLNRSICLDNLGHLEDALSCIRESVSLYREQVKRQPTIFHPELAGSLNNLCIHLSALDRQEEALAAIWEAVIIQRNLVKHRPTVFNPDLAISLNNLSNQFSALGLREEALAAIREAVTIRRELAKDQPIIFNSYLAGSLSNLSAELSAIGQREEALMAIREAVAIRRQSTKHQPTVFNSDLAMSLNNLSTRLSTLGQLEEAVSAIQEAVDIQQELAKNQPTVFSPDLALYLNNLSSELSNLGRQEEALGIIWEALTIRRQLTKNHPTAFKPDLASSLNNLSISLFALGQREAALEAVQEAVTIQRELANNAWARFGPDLALYLNNLSAHLSDLGEQEKASEAIEESIGVQQTSWKVRMVLAYRNRDWFCVEWKTIEENIRRDACGFLENPERDEEPAV